MVSFVLLARFGFYSVHARVSLSPVSALCAVYNSGNCPLFSLFLSSASSDFFLWSFGHLCVTV